MYDPDKYIHNLKELKWYSIDLDGTLAEKVETYSRGIGKPIERNIKKLHEVAEAGYKIQIITARHWEDYEAIERWLNDHHIPFKQIICGKPLCHRYVDDKGINAEEKSWLLTIEG